MAKPARGRGTDFSAGSQKATKPAPQPTKRASLKSTEANPRKFSNPR